MRTLIRDLKTGMFYGSDGQWTAEREDARDFGGTFYAMSFAGENRLREVEVVLAFEMPDYDIRIGLNRGQHSPGNYRKGTGTDS
jgi:hypothetical protein